MIRLWPFTKDMLIRPIQWLMERKTVFNRDWNKEARKIQTDKTDTKSSS
jgi:hypothetical protein